MTHLSLLDPIIIVGGGTFGTSTAYHLARRGYTSVTVLDRWPVPSKEAAGNDLNKIVRTEYPEPIYAQLAQDAVKVWRNDPLFKNLYHQTGWALIASDVTLAYTETSIQTQKQLGLESAEAISTTDLLKRFPALGGSLDGWKAFWNPEAGWVNAQAALKCMADAAVDQGVKYITGDSGHVIELLFDDASACVGVRCKDGTSYFGSQIIVAAGAAAATLLDLEGQIVAKGHPVCHIQLTPEAAEKYSSLPIICHLDEGILFPPQEDGVLKVTTNSFLTNYSPLHPDVSLPRYGTDDPLDDVPEHKQQVLRDWMKQFVPELADLPWSLKKLCWDGDTADSHFLITPSKSHKNLSVAIGGSAHGFKFLPIIGKHIVNMLEGSLDSALEHKWRWRPGTMATGLYPFPTPLEDMNDLPEYRENPEL